MYTLKWGIPETTLTPNKITDDQYFELSLAHKLLYKKEAQYNNSSSTFESYSSAPSTPIDDYAPPSYDYGSSSDSSSYDSGSPDTGSSFDFGGGDGGGGGASGDW